MNLSRYQGLGSVTTIQNDSMVAIIDSFGAKCLALMIDGQNQLFYEESDIGHSGIPLCFPSFGPLDDSEFQHGGKSWPMKQHGFVRDLELERIENTSDSVTYRLTHNEETLKRYPFEFELLVTHKLLANGLNVELVFENQSADPAPIAPGIHPYFAVNDPESVTVTTKAEQAYNNLDGYQLQALSGSDYFDVALEEDGVKTLTIRSNPDQHIPEHGLESTRITRGHQPAITIQADPIIFKLMTVWRKHADSRFICVEPANLQNALNTMPTLVKPKEKLKIQIGLTVG